MTGYTQVLGLSGQIKADVVSRDADGIYVATSTACPPWMLGDAQAYQAWLAAGNTPSAPLVSAVVPAVTPYQIALALNVQGSGPSAASDAAMVRAKPSDRNRWKARTDPVPVDNPVFVRMCGLAGIDPVPLHALAVQQ